MNICGYRLNFFLLITCFIFSSIQAAIDWSPNNGLALIPQNGQVLAPSIASDGSKNLLAVWQQKEDQNYIIKGAKLPFGSSTWQLTGNISEADQNGYSPEIVTDKNGNSLVIWSSSDGSEVIIKGAKLANGSNNWIKTSDLSIPSFDFLSVMPQLVMDENGNALALWVRFDDDNFIIQGAWLPNGTGDWMPTIDLSVSGQDSFKPQVAMNGNGYAVAVWESFNDNQRIIQSATIKMGSTFWTPVEDVSHDESAGSPQVAIDALGNAKAVWTYFNGSNIQIKSAILKMGATSWTKPQDLSDSGQNSSSPCIGMDPKGNAVALWTRYDGNHYIIESSKCSKDGDWEKANTLSEKGGEAEKPQVAVDKSGNIVAVWSRFDGSRYVTQVTLGSLRGNWRPIKNLSGNEWNAINPQVIFNKGFATAVWLGHNGGTSNIFTSSINPVPLPPKSFRGQSVKNRFATKTVYVNRLTWEPSADKNIVSYRIYRNDSLIATVKAKEKPIYDDKRGKNSRDTYALVSVNKLELESEPLSINLAFKNKIKVQ